MDKTAEKKKNRYERLYTQLSGLLTKTDDLTARMATVSALLHHKMDGFFWTGFYLLKEGDLIVGPYQGPVACQVLNRHVGVCWAAVLKNEAIIVPDVHQFPGHIACDSRSNAEICIPVCTKDGKVAGVLDIDSRNFNQFDETDAMGLSKICQLLL